MPEGDAIRAAIRELQGKLERQQLEITQTKSAINVLCSTLGDAPMFPDLEKQAESASTAIRPDRYFQKSITVAAREYLTSRGSAASLSEIIDALKKGGCDLGANPVKNVKISLAKNSGIFAEVTADTFGLWEMYGGRSVPRARKPSEVEAVDRIVAGEDIDEVLDDLSGKEKK
jgi:hypothetical protein